MAFLTASNYHTAGNSILFYKNDLCGWQEPTLPFQPYPECTFHHYHGENASTIQQDNIVFRPETSEIQYGWINALGHLGPNEFVIDEHVLPRLIECNVKIPSPDNLTPQRMEAMIWSFAPGEPSHVFQSGLYENRYVPRI